MKQYYFYITLLACFLAFSNPVNAQNSLGTQHFVENPIEGLSIYPNPVTNGRVYITTSRNLEKDIQIFNVLGKPVKRFKIKGKELDVSNLKAGIYILKIVEGKDKATRKLVIR